jgi:hypothetical protein
MVDYVVTQRVQARGRARARDTSLIRNLDWVLLATVVGLVGYGLWAIDGITKFDVTGDPDFYVKRQAGYAVLGAIGLIVAVLIDPQLYRKHSRIVYGALIAMLLLGGYVALQPPNNLPADAPTRAPITTAIPPTLPSIVSTSPVCRRRGSPSPRRWQSSGVVRRLRPSWMVASWSRPPGRVAWRPSGPLRMRRGGPLIMD